MLLVAYRRRSSRETLSFRIKLLIAARASDLSLSSRAALWDMLVSVILSMRVWQRWLGSAVTVLRAMG